ncbi:MAG: hypothetical protein HY821_06710 [Acidobacteria bacterium]|nr:hypothetical protein [Acidobacteriota bacterium]
MSTYVFIELPSPLHEWVDAPDALFPARAEVAAELQNPDEPQPELLLLELERYIDEFPDKQPRFARAGSQLALRTALEVFTNGMREEALPFYELALRLNPDDFLARFNYAISLHSLSFRQPALEQYYLLMARTTPRENYRIWILAAQIHLYRDEFQQVVDLLEPLSRESLPEDEEYWDLLGDAKSRLNSAPPAVPPPAAAPVCAACGSALPAGMRFCGYCGAKVG